MKLTFLAGLAVAGTMTLTSTANAASWDFGQIAEDFYNANGYEAVWSDLAGTAVMTSNGVTLTNMATPGTSQAIFDRPNAGVGVCSTSNGFGCSTGGHPSNVGGTNLSDDNIQGTEYIDMSFSTALTFTEIVIHGVAHVPFTGTIQLNFVDVAVVAGIVQDLSGVANTSVLNFDVLSNSTDPQHSYYVHSISTIPLPAGVLLLLSGLGGLALVGRRRRMMAA